MSTKMKLFFRLLVIFVMIAVFTTACSSGTPAQQPEKATEPAATVTVYALAPSDWDSVSIWAWKDGGSDVFEAWPGNAMDSNPEGWYTASIPEWADRVIINGNDGTVQTADLTVEAGKDVWIRVMDAANVSIYYEAPAIDNTMPTLEIDVFRKAAQRGDYETMKELLPSIKDRSILTDWDYNDFNYAYAVDCIRAGDYQTAMEFFGYCAFEDDRLYVGIIEKLVAGDLDGAIDALKAKEFRNLDYDLDMTWPEIICMVSGVKENMSELDQMLLDEYLARCMWTTQPSFTEDSLVFGESSAWMADSYVGEITDTEYYPPVENLNSLKSQCGSEANGKVLIVRSQKSYPQGSTYYAIDLNAMEYLGYDLYPASLSEVEYIIVANYDYTVAGQYKQTFSMGENSVEEYFSFLRMKGQVQLLNVLSGATIQQSQWVQGTGEVEAHFSDLPYQCSNMPETGVHIISAVEKVRQLNAG